MAEMLDLSDLSNKDFKGSLTKMLQRAITNTLETNVRNRKFQGEEKPVRYKKDPNKNFRTKKKYKN